MVEPEVFEQPPTMSGRWLPSDGTPFYTRSRYFNAGALGNTVACILIDRWLPCYDTKTNVTIWAKIAREIKTCGGEPLHYVGKGLLQMPDGRILNVIDWPEL